jgi:hypothetical protein
VASNGGVSAVDTLAPVPTAVLLAPGDATSVAWDRVHHRLYAARSTNNLTVFEGDRTSPAFGSIITSITSNHQTVSISADGNVLALLNTLSGAVARRVANPALPTYLNSFWGTTPPLMFQGNGFSTAPVHISPDARVVSVQESSFGQYSALHRFDTVLGSWIDHAPAVAGNQPLSSSTNPWVPDVFGVLRAIDGSAMCISGGSGAITRLELSLSTPATLVSTAVQAAFLPDPSQYLSVDPTGRVLLRADFPSGTDGPVSLSLVEIASGAATPVGTVPNGGGWNAGPIAWR